MKSSPPASIFSVRFEVGDLLRAGTRKKDLKYAFQALTSCGAYDGAYCADRKGVGLPDCQEFASWRR